MNFNRDEIYEDLKTKSPEVLAQLSFAEFCAAMYWFPSGDAKRLNKTGCKYFKKFYPNYEVEVLAGLDKKDIPAKHYIFLDKYCKRPYYIGTDKIVFFDEEEAFLFKICGGDIDNVDTLFSEE